MKTFNCLCSSSFSRMLAGISNRMLLLTVTAVLLCATSALAQTPNKVYFSDDFENGVSKWVASSGTWGLITTDFRSGANSISASPGQNYAANANSILAIPATKAIDLTSATNPYLSFWHKYSIASACLGGPFYCTWNYDYGYVEVSTNYGVAWTQIASFTGEITSWTPQELDLTPYIGKKILVRFRLWDGGFGSESWGWFLDDIEVREKGPLTVGVTVSVTGAGTVTGNGISCPSTCAEIFPSNWNLSGRDWALIDTDYEAPPASISASPNGNYPLYANSTLELADAVDISTATAPALSYWDKYSIPSSCLGGPLYCTTYYDYGYVEVSQDYGVTWTQLTKTKGLVSGWTPETVDLTPYITEGPILVRFRLRDGGYGNLGWGWEVDDVEISDLPTDTVYFSDDFSSPTSVPDFSDITLTATPSAGYALPTWTGCNSTDENQCTFNRYIDRAVNATFATAPAPTISFTVPNQTYGAAPFTVEATSNSAGAITYSVVSGPATVVNGPETNVDAMVTLTGLGTVVLQASQAASSNYAAGTEQATFTVNPDPQTITFPAIATQYALTQLTLPATASSGLAVSYASTTQAICTVSGVTASLLLPGTCTIQATQAGNAAYAAAAMVQQSFSVARATQSITFTPVTGTQYALTSLSISATATSGLAVSFASATSSVCTVSGSTVSLLIPGVCVIHATQGGSALYFSAAMVSLDIVAAKVQQTITFPAITATQYALGKVTLSATASSGLDVTFASASPAVCTISGTTASLLQQGTCIVQATQAGSSLYAVAPMVQQNIVVHLAPQTITFPAPAAEQFALTQLQLTATATSGLAITYSSITPAVCTVSGSIASLLQQGICYLHATQTGSNVYSVAQLVVQSVIVHLAPQTITFPAITATEYVLSQLTLSATASSGLTVSFASATPAVCAVSGTTASLLTTGDCVIHATQAGNKLVYAVAQLVSQSFIVHANPQTITFPAITATLTAASTLPLSAAASSGLTVSFASTTPTVCTVSGTTASLLTSGICIVQAKQAGNASYAAAAPVQQNLVVHMAAQTITFPAIAAQVVGANVTLGATASSGLAVTYTSVTTPVCTVSGSTATMVSAGACVIHATQAGNATYAAAPLLSKLIVVNAAAVQ